MRSAEVLLSVIKVGLDNGQRKDSSEVVLFNLLLFVLEELFLLLGVVVFGVLNPVVDSGNNEGNPKHLNDVDSGVDGEPDPLPDIVNTFEDEKEGLPFDPEVNEGSLEGPHDGHAEHGSGELVVEEREKEPSPGNGEPGFQVAVKEAS